MTAEIRHMESKTPLAGALPKSLCRRAGGGTRTRMTIAGPRILSPGHDTGTSSTWRQIAAKAGAGHRDSGMDGRSRRSDGRNPPRALLSSALIAAAYRRVRP